jgi:hypothetical protein
MTNPNAVYLFKEDNSEFTGKRLFLKMDKQTSDRNIIDGICAKQWPGPYCDNKYLEGSSLVYFNIDEILPLVVFDK